MQETYLEGSWIHEITTSQDHARIHLVRLQAMRSCPNHWWFGPINVTNPAASQGKTVIERWFIQSPAK